MSVLEVAAAFAVTVGCVGIVMLAAIAANRLYEHQDRAAAERRARRNSQQPSTVDSTAASEGRLFTTPWDGDHTP